MPGYDRFVAYIYLYEHGIRIKNTGFVKVQKREGTCRVEIKLRGTGNASLRSGRVYLFRRDKERLLGTQIGDMRSADRTGVLQMLLSEEDVMATGIPFDEMKGLLIQVSEEQVYAAEWDDMGIQVKQFEAAGKKSEVREAEVQSSRPFVESAEVPVKGPDTGNIEQEKEPAGNAEPVRDTIPATAEQPAADTSEEPERIPEVPAEEEIKEPESELQIPAAETEPPAGESGPQRSSRMAAGRGRRKQLPSSWKYMTEKFTHFPAFQDDEIRECIRIQPKDLAHLPKQEWSLGNNSFMLHGYYNYKYLLMGRRMEQGKDCIILGVPGVYHNQERAMAAMFGFPHFKPARQPEEAQQSEQDRPEAHMQGVFGYWYRIVAIESDS